MEYVNAGKTLNDQPPDENPEIIHVDTGNGKFDHHDDKGKTCAAQLVLDFLITNNHVDPRIQPALQRLIQFVMITDHFGESHFPDAPSDIYDFCLHQIVNGLNHTRPRTSEVLEITFSILEATLQNLRNKIRAENEIQKGQTFTSKWGKTLVMETKNEEAMKLAMKQGVELVIRRDPTRGGFRIKSLPSQKSNLSELYKKIQTVDSIGKWYFHPSGNLLLNSSSINPDLTPSPITLPELVEIIKSVR